MWWVTSCLVTSMYQEEFDPWPVFCITAFDCPCFRWLFRDGLLPDDTYFVGFARSNLTVEDIKTGCLPHMKVVHLKAPCWLSETRLVFVWGVFSGIIVQHFPQVTDEESECLSAFFSKNSYLRGRYDDDSSFSQLNAHLSSLPGGADANRLFYLALPPTVYHHVSANIRTHGMSRKSVSVPLTQTMVDLLFDDIILIRYVCKTEAGTG